MKPENDNLPETIVEVSTGARIFVYVLFVLMIIAFLCVVVSLAYYGGYGHG